MVLCVWAKGFLQLLPQTFDALTQHWDLPRDEDRSSMRSSGRSIPGHDFAPPVPMSGNLCLGREVGLPTHSRPRVGTPSLGTVVVREPPPVAWGPSESRSGHAMWAPLFFPHPPPITIATVPHPKPKQLLGNDFPPLLGVPGCSSPAPLPQSDRHLWPSLLHPLAFQGSLSQPRV